uniref:hypothetical protein n=1 Tax=Myxobolus shantungensis TaxID=904554 RepID=UPI0030026C66
MNFFFILLFIFLLYNFFYLIFLILGINIFCVLFILFFYFFIFFINDFFMFIFIFLFIKINLNNNSYNNNNDNFSYNNKFLFSSNNSRNSTDNKNVFINFEEELNFELSKLPSYKSDEYEKLIKPIELELLINKDYALDTNLLNELPKDLLIILISITDSININDYLVILNVEDGINLIEEKSLFFICEYKKYIGEDGFLNETLIFFKDLDIIPLKYKNDEVLYLRMFFKICLFTFKNKLELKYGFNKYNNVNVENRFDLNVLINEVRLGNNKILEFYTIDFNIFLNIVSNIENLRYFPSEDTSNLRNTVKSLLIIFESLDSNNFEVLNKILLFFNKINFNPYNSSLSNFYNYFILFCDFLTYLITFDKNLDCVKLDFHKISNTIISFPVDEDDDDLEDDDEDYFTDDFEENFNNTLNLNNTLIDEDDDDLEDDDLEEVKVFKELPIISIEGFTKDNIFLKYREDLLSKNFWNLDNFNFTDINTNNKYLFKVFVISESFNSLDVFTTYIKIHSNINIELEYVYKGKLILLSNIYINCFGLESFKNILNFLNSLDFNTPTNINEFLDWIHFISNFIHLIFENKYNINTNKTYMEINNLKFLEEYLNNTIKTENKNLYLIKKCTIKEIYKDTSNSLEEIKLLDCNKKNINLLKTYLSIFIRSYLIVFGKKSLESIINELKILNFIPNHVNNDFIFIKNLLFFLGYLILKRDSRKSFKKNKN